MYETSDVAEWARRHRITLKARRIEGNDEEERWVVSALTERGKLVLEITTDGSYEPTAFGQLFEPWLDDDPSPEEFNATLSVLGEEATAELALILGWPRVPPAPPG